MDWAISTTGTTILIVLAFVYVGGTVLLHAVIRWNFEPEIDALDPASDVLDAAFRSYAHACHDVLIGLGFEAGPLLLAKGVLKNFDAYAGMYLRRTDAQRASVTMQVRIVNGRRRPLPGLVELANDFSGGLSVSTHNGPCVLFQPPGPDEVVVYAPGERSIAALVALHEEACRRAGGIGNKRDLDPGWGERLFRSGLGRYAERGVRHGYLRTLPDGRHGLTWKGAFILTCMTAFATKWYFRRRAAVALRELKRTMPAMA